jgi:hypothetical protein
MRSREVRGVAVFGTTPLRFGLEVVSQKNRPGPATGLHCRLEVAFRPRRDGFIDSVLCRKNRSVMIGTKNSNAPNLRTTQCTIYMQSVSKIRMWKTA